MEVLIEKIKSRIEDKIDEAHDGYNPVIEQTFRRALNIIEEEYGKDTNVTTNNSWIPCSERLPEETGFYIVTHMHPLKDEWSSTIFYYDSVRKVFTLPNDKTYDVKPIAWQLLPEPYKEKL